MTCALDRGDEVVAVVRRAGSVTASHPNLSVVEAPLSDAARLEAALHGADGVVSALGVSRATPDDAPSRSLPAVIEAMRKAGVSRYVGVSGAAIDVPGDRKDLPGRMISWLVRRIAPAVFEDKTREYQLVSKTDLHWTLVRAPRLTDGPAGGGCRADLTRSPGTKVSRDDLANFMLAQVHDLTYDRKAPFVAT